MIEVGMGNLIGCYRFKEDIHARSLGLLLRLIGWGLCSSISWSIGNEVFSHGREAIEKDNLTQKDISAVEE